MIRRVGSQWKSNPKNVTKQVNRFSHILKQSSNCLSFQVSGSALSHIMDLRKIQEREDWSPDCENLTASVTSNRFNFTMRSVDETQLSSENVMFFLFDRAVVANPDGNIFVGEWSRPLTLPAVCQSEYCSSVVLRQEISNLLIELSPALCALTKLAHLKRMWRVE